MSSPEPDEFPFVAWEWEDEGPAWEPPPGFFIEWPALWSKYVHKGRRRGTAST